MAIVRINEARRRFRQTARTGSGRVTRKMRSLVTDLQRDILNSKKSVTEILRTAKLISAKLGLNDISGLIESELSGYSDLRKVPGYREMVGGNLYYFNPARGWCFAGNISPQEYR